jgi:nucleotide-binding universal stress UspA family protein
VSDGLDQLLGPWRAEYPDVELVTATPAERPVDAVMDAAHVSQLVVLGRHDRGGRHMGPRLGSTLRSVLHRARIPVAVVADGDIKKVEPTTHDHSDVWAPMY